MNIPKPKFLVFYNGKEDYPVEQTLKLSTAFYETDADINLELAVRVININPEKGHDILKKCKVLREYSQFVEITRKYREDENQLQKAVKECIDNGILADYLLRKSSEVINMLMAEYDYETDIAVQRQEAAEEAAEKAAKKADDKRFVEDIDKIAKNFHISVQEACEKMESSYEKYLEIKNRLK